MESINKNLKAGCVGGTIDFESALGIIRDFKSDYLSKYEHHVVNGNLNRRKAKTLKRQAELRDIIDHFYELSRPEQLDEVVQTAYKLFVLTAYRSCSDSL